MIKVRLEGIEELKKIFKQLDREVKKQIYEKAVQEGAEMVVQTAKAKVPVDTGALKESIKIIESKAGEKGSFSKVGSDIAIHKRDAVTRQAHGYYSFFTEYGTSRMPARPFIRPALDENSQKIKDKFIEVLKSEVERYNA